MVGSKPSNGAITLEKVGESTADPTIGMGSKLGEVDSTLIGDLLGNVRNSENLLMKKFS
jgi:hypothetical protein